MFARIEPTPALLSLTIFALPPPLPLSETHGQSWGQSMPSPALVVSGDRGRLLLCGMLDVARAWPVLGGECSPAREHDVLHRRVRLLRAAHVPSVRAPSRPPSSRFARGRCRLGGRWGLPRDRLLSRVPALPTAETTCSPLMHPSPAPRYPHCHALDVCVMSRKP